MSAYVFLYYFPKKIKSSSLKNYFFEKLSYRRFQNFTFYRPNSSVISQKLCMYKTSYFWKTSVYEAYNAFEGYICIGESCQTHALNRLSSDLVHKMSVFGSYHEFDKKPYFSYNFGTN